MDPVSIALVKQGLLGTLLAGAILVAYWRDRQMRELYDRLLAKSEKMLQKYSELAHEQDSTLRALTEALKNRGHDK